MINQSIITNKKDFLEVKSSPENTLKAYNDTFLLLDFEPSGSTAAS